MRLYLALLLSLTLHAALIVAPALLAKKMRPPAIPVMEAHLLRPPPAESTAEAVSSRPPPEDSRPLAAAPVPKTLQGGALRRAQTAFSEHLFYPPQAVAQGLEGDVVLLLTLADGGRLISASIARSSGHALLDQAALDAAQRIGALPGNPPQTLFPVSFRLQ